MKEEAMSKFSEKASHTIWFYWSNEWTYEPTPFWETNPIQTGILGAENFDTYHS